MRFTHPIAVVAAAVLGLGSAAVLAAAPASAHTAELTGAPVCQASGSGEYDITWTGQTANVPAHDTGTVTVTGWSPNVPNTGTGPQQPTPNPVAANAGFTIAQVNVPGTSGSAALTVRIDWVPATDPATGQPYPDGDTYSTTATGTVTLSEGCGPTAPTPAFTDQQGCGSPASYILYTRPDVEYSVNGGPATAGGLTTLPANYAGTITVIASDTARGTRLGSWSHSYAVTGSTSCVNPATVHLAATASCGTVTGTITVTAAGAVTAVRLDDVVSGAPLAGADYTVQPGQQLPFTYRLIPANRPAAPDTVYLNIASDHTGTAQQLSLSVPHGPAATPQVCIRPATPVTPARPQPHLARPAAVVRVVPAAAVTRATAAPALANTGVTAATWWTAVAGVIAVIAGGALLAIGVSGRRSGPLTTTS